MSVPRFKARAGTRFTIGFWFKFYCVIFNISLMNNWRRDVKSSGVIFLSLLVVAITNDSRVNLKGILQSVEKLF